MDEFTHEEAVALDPMMFGTGEFFDDGMDDFIRGGPMPGAPMDRNI